MNKVIEDAVRAIAICEKLLDKNGYSISGSLHQHLYDRQEQNALSLLFRLPPLPKETLDISKAKQVIERYSSVRHWQMARFFDIYKGFIEGELDMSGRHEARWTEYLGELQEYMQDFATLAPSISQVLVQKGWRRNKEKYIKYVTGDRRAYERFLKRWDLTTQITDFVLRKSFELQLIWEHRPRPIFQALTLDHLPQEVLELVYALCSRCELYALCQTSRDFYSSASRALWQKLDFCLYSARRTTPAVANRDIDWELPVLPQILPSLQSAQAWFTRRIEPLHTRPDRCSQIKHLRLNIDPSSFVPSMISGQLERELDDELRQHFLHGLQREASRLLPLSIGLTTLELTLFEFNNDALASLCLLVRLETLNLEACDFDSDSSRVLVATSHGYSLSVINLHLAFDRKSQDISGLWHALCICPHIRNLSLLARTGHGGVNSLHFPLRHVREAFSCSIGSLERLSISGLSQLSFERFAVWIYKSRNTLPPDVPPALTHLKLAFNNAWSAQYLLGTLSLLRSTALVALSLDGIDYSLTGGKIFKAVSKHFPNTRGLTLIARQNNSQVVTKPVVWRLPIWRYARLLARLPKIEHFDWNNTIPADIATPASLKEMEQHETEPKLMPDGSPWWCFDDGIFDDSHLDAAPFAADCPNLKTWATTGGLYHRKSVYEIQGSAEMGGPSERIVWMPQGRWHEVEKWDPEDRYGNPAAWPDIRG
ncbi:hypothetical protein BKA70DRAFT_1574402 [Coprinopsis sp. MPI-PUGE-AT-0042]|nr:hypothetical protein BKA70DRAFT_1574402 [Coprinopsis sp. MPI-PUGE-AT-0042]